MNKLAGWISFTATSIPSIVPDIAKRSASEGSDSVTRPDFSRASWVCMYDGNNGPSQVRILVGLLQVLCPPSFHTQRLETPHQPGQKPWTRLAD